MDERFSVAKLFAPQFYCEIVEPVNFSLLKLEAPQTIIPGSKRAYRIYRSQSGSKLDAHGCHRLSRRDGA
jgi:hypothetical protein